MAWAWQRDRAGLTGGALKNSVLAVLLLTSSVGEWPTGPADDTARMAAMSALIAGTVLARRRFPVAAFAVALVIAGTQVAFGLHPDNIVPPVKALEPTVTDLAIPVLLYTLAARRPRRISLSGLAVCLAGVGAALARWAPAGTAYPQGGVFVAAAGAGGVVLAAWVLGDSVAYRYRRQYYASLEERTARAEAERDAQAQIAAAAERARELQDRRGRAVDESAARLRRIERDLHDGTQVRLAALAMMLGEIKEYLEVPGSSSAGDADRARSLIGAAHRNAKDTLAELRDLARGIHPPVLDRGLGPALSSLAGTSAVPTVVTVELDGAEPSPAIAAIVYFCAAELLANAAKHSGASRATLEVGDDGGRLVMTVTDDGAGGALPVPGGGLAGLRERVQTVDGQLSLHSPTGGPTVVTVELPRQA
jgi:signal transduction histidine kinase